MWPVNFTHNHVDVSIDVIKSTIDITTIVVYRVTHVIANPHYGTTLRNKHYCLDVAHFLFIVMLHVHKYFENPHRFLYYNFTVLIAQTY